MTMKYSGVDLLLYSIIYAFVGWAAKVACAALRDRHFVNHGFLNLPISISSGITAAILLVVLPTLENHVVLQFFMTCIIMALIEKLTEQYVKSISGWRGTKQPITRSMSAKAEAAACVLSALAYLVTYLVIHPFIFTFVNCMPDVLALVLTIILAVVILIDYIGVHYTMRTRRVLKTTELRKERTQGMAREISDRIWGRLEKAYPGIGRSDQPDMGSYIFAKGICFDKLVWVFLITAFLGALIEMVFCRLVGQEWMNRSSLLYGAFSVVWGFGAVVLTVVLQRLAGKPDRYVFLAGFVIGGAYEYLCSVVSELVFGTVFWDYSEMPLNIGGRTNVLFCIFWGLLSVAWIKVAYPRLDRWIEQIPPLLGKSITWVIVFAMLCDGLLTAAAMCRYTFRQTQPEAANMVEEFLDERYNDAWMENRWPNMKIPSQETQ